MKRHEKIIIAVCIAIIATVLLPGVIFFCKGWWHWFIASINYTYK